MTIDKRGIRVLLAVLLVPLAGCVGQHNADRVPLAGTAESEMLQAPRQPLALWSPVPGLGASARDFLYLAPIDSNISGERQFYLWCGFASTVDALVRPAAFQTIVEISLLVGEDRLVLNLEPFTPGEGGLFATPLPTVLAYRAKVSAEELRLLAQSGALNAISTAVDSTEQAFDHWGGERSSWASVAEENSLQIKAAAHHAPLLAPAEKATRQQ